MYQKLRRGGYPLGSGGIESSNKFICHVRLKRSGAWWYEINSNQMLALRCAKLSLSRLNHGQPRVQAHPEIVQGATELHHHITDTCFPKTNAVFDDRTALDTAIDMLNAQPTLVERLVRVLLP
jgi:hypothetical protein